MSGEPGTTRNQMVSTPSAAADASRAPDTEPATWLVGCSGEVDTFRYRPGLRSPPGTRCRPDHHGRPQSPGHLERTRGGPPGRIRPRTARRVHQRPAQPGRARPHRTRTALETIPAIDARRAAVLSWRLLSAQLAWNGAGLGVLHGGHLADLRLAPSTGILRSHRRAAPLRSWLAVGRLGVRVHGVRAVRSKPACRRSGGTRSWPDGCW